MRAFEGERGVSDVLAFIIVFSIIITSVALVYGTGFSSLDQVREGEQKANAERAMEALALSMDDVVSGSTPRRSGSLSLGGGQLTVNGSETRVLVDGTAVYQNTTNALAYTVGKTTVAYENGGVFRSDRGASVSVRRASMTCTNDRAVVSVVVLRTDSGAVDSEGDVEVTMAERNSSVVFRDTDGTSPNTVTVVVDDTQFSEAWARYLDDASGYDWDASQSGNSATATCFNTERVVVRVTVVDVTIDTP